jgi:hypothetical protein
MSMIQAGNISRRAALAIVAGASIAAAGPIRSEERIPIKVSRDAGCGCCGKWAAHLEAAGFAVTITEPADMAGLKASLGVPSDLASCHTGEVAGYVIEGHVPAAAIKRLLEAKPQAIGLAVPGMPSGSPGMEGDEPEVYEVVQFGPAVRSSFGSYRGGVQV